MKSIGEQVAEYRKWRGWNTREMAEAVGGGVKRQHIEQLEAVAGREPRYLARLAKAMNVSADDLLNGRYKAPAFGRQIEAMESQPAPLESPVGLPATVSSQAAEIAAIFDMLPADRLLRARLLGELAQKLAPYIEKKGGEPPADLGHSAATG